MLHHRLLFALLLLVSCAASGDGDDPWASEVIVIDPVELGRLPATGVDPEYEPAFQTVIQALEDGNELVARSTLNRLLARGPDGATLEFARALERVLDGRELCSRLDMRMEAIEDASVRGRWFLTLVIHQETEMEIALLSGGAQLRQLLLIVDPDGREQRASRLEPVPWPEEVVLPSGEEVRLALTEIELPTPAGLLALSSRLLLEITTGEFVEPEGRYLPARNLVVEPLEIVRLASFLPTAPVEPEELVRYVRGGRIFVPALMERAVRIRPAERGRALDLLAPEMERMSVVELELLVPALRWLSRTVRPGGDPEAWRDWMRQRARVRSGKDAEQRQLDLPGEG